MNDLVGAVEPIPEAVAQRDGHHQTEGDDRG
jgi:hypothetical protein